MRNIKCCGNLGFSEANLHSMSPKFIVILPVHSGIDSKNFLEMNNEKEKVGKGSLISVKTIFQLTVGAVSRPKDCLPVKNSQYTITRSAYSLYYKKMG